MHGAHSNPDCVPDQVQGEIPVDYNYKIRCQGASFRGHCYENEEAWGVRGGAQGADEMSWGSGGLGGDGDPAEEDEVDENSCSVE